MNLEKLLEKNMRDVPAPERRALARAARQAAKITDPGEKCRVADELARLAILLARQARKRASDRRTDHARRVLVGARLERDRAERYRQAAAQTGRSLYRFVADALECEYNVSTAAPHAATLPAGDGRSNS